MLSRRYIAATLIGAVLTGQAFAAPVAGGSTEQKTTSLLSNAPLPAGRPASIREAQGIGRPLLYWGAGGAAIVAGVILLAQDSDEGTTATTVTTSTTN